MRKVFALSVLFLVLPFFAMAQSFNPVIEENSVDGLLLGAEGSYKFFGWLEPSLGIAYGLQSQKLRYRAGVGVWDAKISVVDWPRTPVLGRIGEAGVKATLKPPWNLPTVSGFFGRLWPWPHDPHPPDIAYAMWESSRSFSLPFGIELGVSQQALVGWWQLGVLPSHFQYRQTQLSLRREFFSLLFSYGTLENKSKLPDFIFVQGVKGDSTTLQGEQFWTLHFERAFDVIAIPMLTPFLPQSLDLLVQGAVFFQIAAAGKSEPPSDAQGGEKTVWQNRLSWGMSVLISFDKAGVTARADFVFTRDGQFQFLFNF